MILINLVPCLLSHHVLRELLRSHETSFPTVVSFTYGPRFLILFKSR